MGSVGFYCFGIKLKYESFDFNLGKKGSGLTYRSLNIYYTVSAKIEEPFKASLSQVLTLVQFIASLLGL